MDDRLLPTDVYYIDAYYIDVCNTIRPSKALSIH